MVQNLSSEIDTNARPPFKRLWLPLKMDAMCVCEEGRSPENFVLTIVVVSASKWVTSFRDSMGAWGLFQNWIDCDKVSYYRWCELMKSAPMIKSLILLQTQTLCMNVFPKICNVIGKTLYRSKELPLASLRPSFLLCLQSLECHLGKCGKNDLCSCKCEWLQYHTRSFVLNYWLWH